mmetsp:Transcript_10926/g.12002  ORF Transcript_10926/g.12002 Transcript_10926/m.12002 type:complete len:80 (-) Transcript_10926:34-273(-)
MNSDDFMQTTFHMKEMGYTLLKTTTSCFENCVGNFRTSQIDEHEEACIYKCFSKYLPAAEQFGENWANNMMVQAQKHQR